MDIKHASFALKDYRFPKIHLDVDRENLNKEEIKIGLTLSPRGEYMPSTRGFALTLHCQVVLSDMPERILADVSCEALFQFSEPLPFERIPDYFYPNSIAIVYPYVRAMLSTLTLQANAIEPIILPTINLTTLGEDLRVNTSLSE